MSISVYTPPKNTDLLFSPALLAPIIQNPLSCGLRKSLPAPPKVAQVRLNAPVTTAHPSSRPSAPKAAGYDQVMWMDAVEKKYVQEVGTMNLFFVMDGKVITPATTGTILRGITRDSFVFILKEWGYTVEDRLLSIAEIADAYWRGTLAGMFWGRNGSRGEPRERNYLARPQNPIAGSEPNQLPGRHSFEKTHQRTAHGPSAGRTRLVG
jgi:hypothetical protein